MSVFFFLPSVLIFPAVNNSFVVASESLSCNRKQNNYAVISASTVETATILKG